MLLIYENEASWDSLSPQERQASIGRHIAFANQLRQEGRFIYGDALQPTSSATSVRKEGERTVVLDGPFAETNEQLGGFYLIEARDLDQALADASVISNRAGEIVEVRPIADLSSGH
ncbi:MAG TPA: YciI family protein [Acidimicrobiia bacterium]|nr:YciI family protein [Acidimicrobiia bacterium]